MLILPTRPSSRLHYCALCASDVEAFHDEQLVRCTHCLAPVESLLTILGSPDPDAAPAEGSRN